MILDKFSLKGKNAIVTGAAQGIGKAVAIGLAQAGANVAGIDLNFQQETKEEIEKLGKEYIEVRANLLEKGMFEAVIKKVVDKWGSLDILVNNAGITRRDMVIDFCEKDWDDVIAVNQTSVFFQAQAAAKQFLKQKTAGRIINIASVSAYEGGMKIPAYTAAKAAVKAFTMSMSNEWAKDGILVNAIAPGFTVTPLTEPMRGEEHRVQEMMTRIPIGRWAQPEDMVGAAVFLASDASAYISGTTIVVDGGYLGR